MTNILWPKKMNGIVKYIKWPGGNVPLTPLEFNVQPDHNIRWVNIGNIGTLKTLGNIMNATEKNDRRILACLSYPHDLPHDPPVGRGSCDSQVLNNYLKTYAESAFYRTIVEYHKGVKK